MVQDDGTKPWLWVAKSEELVLCEDATTAEQEAAEYLKDVTAKIQKIQENPSIPVRSNKKKGIKSKKDLREELQYEASEKLKEVSIRHGFVAGKWLIFAPSDRVNAIWSTIANSLISGPLASTAAFTAKVATSPQAESSNHQNVLCIYLPDVYDKDIVTDIMKTLLRKHGVNLSGVKSNLYTAIGLDSKHPSGIQSTIWRNTSLMKDADLKSLKDEYFAELGATKTANNDKPAETKMEATTAPKPKPKLKKKQNDDPFGSDEEDAGDKGQDTSAKPGKKIAAKPRPAPKGVTSKKRPKIDEDDDEAEEKPKKRKGGK